MKQALTRISRPLAFFAVAAMLMTGAAPKAVQAEVWNATAGAQSTDKSKAVLAFLTNELWIHAGDSIRWIQATNEIHTISFLKTGQIRPALYAPFGVIACSQDTWAETTNRIRRNSCELLPSRLMRRGHRLADKNTAD